MSFWKEIKRRNVVKVGIAYAIVSWLIIHPVDIIFPTLHLPEWTTTFVTALFIIAFPFVLIFSWVYEITPKGLKKTKDVPLTKSITQLTGRRLNYIIMGLLLLVVAYLLFDKYFIGRGAVETKQVPAISEAVKAKNTIAVLPFEDLSPNSDQGYFVLGLSEEILNSLAQIPDLNVTGKTSSFTFKGSNKKTPEIANELGVENILEGSVRKAGNSLRITAQLLCGKDGFHLWSNNYDRELKDIFAVQEEIAMAVAEELKVTLGIVTSLKQFGGTENEEAYGLFLVAKGLISNGEGSRALEPIDAALALDPKFALAWALKANTHGSNAKDIPYGLVAAELDAQLLAAQRAIELEPNLAEANVALAHTKTARHEWVDAELIYRKAIELKNKQTSENFNLDTMGALLMHYWSVGNIKKAHELGYQIRLNDPLNPTMRALYIQILGINGEMQEAENEDDRCSALFGDEWNSYNWAITSLRLGIDDSLSPDEIKSYNPVDDAAKEHLDSTGKGLSKLHRLYTDDTNLTSSNFRVISRWAAYFGDPEFAMDAIEKSVSFQGINAIGLWLPVMRGVRQTPRFKKFVKDIGLVDYWNKFGWPDMCHQLDNGDFECD